MSTSVLIAGLGYVGSEVAKSLLLEGFSVVGVTRTPFSPERTMSLRASASRSEALDLRAINLCFPEELRSLPVCDVVIFCAAARGSDEQAYREIYIDGLRNLLTAMQTWPARPRQLIFTSSTGVYHQHDGSAVTEESATTPRHFSGQIMLAAEELIRSSGFTYQILRLSGIYGPGRDRIIRQVREGMWQTKIIADEYQNRIHRDDVAAAIVAILQHEGPSSTLIVSDVEPALKSTVVEYVANEFQKIGQSIPALPIFIEQSSRNKRCLSLKLQSRGFVFKYPTFREGIKALFCIHSK